MAGNSEQSRIAYFAARPWCGFAALVILFSAAFACHAAQPDAIITLHHVERLYSDAQATPPSDVTTGWTAVELKDVWRLRQRARHQEAWYRTDFSLTESPDEEFSLYIPRIASAASIWINGIEIENTGGFSEPVVRNWNHPIYAPIPSALLVAGNNHIDTRLKVYPAELGYLFEVSVGPTRLLNPIYETTYFAKVTAAKILTSIMLISVAVIFAFYFSVNLPNSYLWFALGSLCWSLYSFELFVREIPVPATVWFISTSFALGAAMYFYTKTVHAILELKRPKVELFLLLICFPYVVALVTLPPIFIGPISTVIVLVYFFTLIYLGLVLCYRGWRSRSQNKLWMIFSGASILILVAYDCVIAIFQITAVASKWPYIPLVAMISGGTVFVIRLIRLAKESESYQQRTREAMTAAVNSERQRLMKEIHDGVGGQLMSTVAQLERNTDADQDVIESLKTSVNDLRLIIHSLENMSQQGDIVTILATIRERMEKNLNKQDIQFDWQVNPLPEIKNFDADDALQLMRIVQEAIANIVKHADASKITLLTASRPHDAVAGISITIADNGRGFNPDLAASGFGLNNMRERAAKLSAHLAIRSGSHGTEIELWLPLAGSKRKVDSDDPALGSH